MIKIIHYCTGFFFLFSAERVHDEFNDDYCSSPNFVPETFEFPPKQVSIVNNAGEIYVLHFIKGPFI